MDIKSQVCLLSPAEHIRQTCFLRLNSLTVVHGNMFDLSQVVSGVQVCMKALDLSLQFSCACVPVFLLIPKQPRGRLNCQDPGIVIALKWCPPHHNTAFFAFWSMEATQTDSKWKGMPALKLKSEKSVLDLYFEDNDLPQQIYRNITVDKKISISTYIILFLRSAIGRCARTGSLLV